MAIIKTSGPVPLLVLAVLFSVALFFVYKELSTVKAKLAALEKSVPEITSAMIEEALRLEAAPVEDESTPNAYDSFAEELPEFAEEAARAMTEAFSQIQFPAQTIKEEPVDITDVTDAPAETDPAPSPAPEPAPAEGDASATVVVKRRSKKVAVE
jgi:hypothetical protein